MPDPWPTLAERELVRAPIFRLMERRVRMPTTGTEHDFYVLETNDWVNVLAFTPARELVCVRQFRHGVGQVTLEIPGGVMEAGEDPVAAGLRELHEETAYRPGGPVELLGAVDSNPAILTNRTHTVLVHNVRLDGAVHLDDTEEVEVVLVPWDELPGLVTRGAFSHALAVAALALLAFRNAP